MNTTELTAQQQNGTANIAATQQESYKAEKQDKLEYSKPDETFERKPVNQAWTMIWDKEKGYSGGIGNRQLTVWYKTEKELMTKLKGVKNGQIDWDLINLVTLTLIDIDRERTELENKIKNHKNG